MKIALVSPYDFSYPGGVANHIMSLERQLTAMGHQVRVIAPASRTVPTFGDRFISIGSPRPLPSSGSITRISISPWIASKIKEVLERENFELIHLHEPLMPMLCTTVLRLSQTANVGTFHAYEGRPGYKFAKPWGTFFLRKWFRKLHSKIAVSKPAMEFANHYLPGEYDIIPNGVDIHHFCPEVKPIEGLCDGKLNILFVGRLEKRKGADYLIKAYLKVKKAIPNSRLVIVGPGTRLRKKYERQVEHDGIADVVFVGQVGFDELPSYYRAADIFCSPATERESFGIVLLEAMASGRPVVCSNIAGYAEVVSHEVQGLLVPPKDEGKLAEALLSLMTDERARNQLGANGRRKSLEYDWEIVARKIFEHYVKARQKFQENHG